MKIEIETYLGWDITFDTDKDTFTAYSNRDDAAKERMSLTAVKKDIDDFIKSNQEFKPFFAEYLPKSFGYKSQKVIKVIGIRKDGRFVIINHKGEKEQLSIHDESNLIALNPQNQPIWKELEKLNEQQSWLSSRISETEKKITGTPISEIRKQYKK